jgi:hypothetical protein
MIIRRKIHPPNLSFHRLWARCSVNKTCALAAILLIPITILNSYESSYHESNLTYHVTKSNFTDYVALQSAINFWKQYGYSLTQSNKAQVNIEFVHYCMYTKEGYVLGYYSAENHMIVISTECGYGKYSELREVKITEHELGHFIGFDHYSIPVMFPTMELGL